MLSITSSIRLNDELRKISKRDKTIGLVPTMGALHVGHEALVIESKKKNDVTVVSIFVNPLQFNNSFDLENYPSNLDYDLERLERLGVDFVFVPDVEEIYPDKPIIDISFGSLTDSLEGSFRPGHFQGVALVVSKLFNKVQPNRAYFGLKDLQQFMIISRLVTDLSFPIEIIGVDTVREDSGLAMSSRNTRLSSAGRNIAGRLHEGLRIIQEELMEGRDLKVVMDSGKEFFDNVDGLELEYLNAVDPSTFSELETFSVENDVAICVAAYVEGIRLIDNLYLRPQTP